MDEEGKIKVTYLTDEKKLEVNAYATIGNTDKFHSPYLLIGSVSDPKQFPAAQALIQHIFETSGKENPKLAPDATFRYGFWLVQLVIREKNQLELWELNQNNQYIPGINGTLLYHKIQTTLCKKHQLPFQPVNLQDVVIVNKNVLASETPVLGFRSVKHEELSGWIVVTDTDDLEDEENTETMYLYHLIIKRPQLIHFFGLPYDTAFYLDKNGYQVWKLDDA